MIFLFEDLSKADNSYYKITANSKEEALLKALKTMLDNEDITTKEICDNLDLNLIDVEDLLEYE